MWLLQREIRAMVQTLQSLLLGSSPVVSSSTKMSMSYIKLFYPGLLKTSTIGS